MPIEVRPIRVVEYETGDGKSPFSDWLDRLDASTQLRVDRRIARVRLGNLGDHESLGGGLIELREHSGAGIRIYCGRDGDMLIILLLGGTKRRQSADIETAREYWDHYKRSQ